MPDYTNEQNAYNDKAAQIAAEILGRGETPVDSGVATSPVEAAIADAPISEAAPPTQNQEPPYVAKLLARIADMEAAVAESRKTTSYTAPTPQEAPKIDINAINADPLRALEALGVDVTNVQRQIVAQALGNEAPPELRAQAAVSGQLANVMRELNELKQANAAMGNELRRRDYSNGLQEYASSVDAGKFPNVAVALSKDAKRVQSELMRVVVDHARSSGATAPLTPEQAVAKLEENLSWLGLASSPQPTAQTAAAAPQPVPTAGQPIVRNPIPGTVTGAPSKLASSELTWEQKTQAILEETKRKYGIA